MSTIEPYIGVLYEPLTVVIMASLCIHWLEIDLVSEENNLHIFYETGKRTPNFALLYRMSLEISRSRCKNIWTCDNGDCLFNTSKTPTRKKVSFVFKKTWNKLPSEFQAIFKNLRVKILEQRTRSKKDLTILFEPHVKNLSNDVENILPQSFRNESLDGSCSFSPGTSRYIHNYQDDNANSSHHATGNVENNRKNDTNKFLDPIWLQSLEIGPFYSDISFLPSEIFLIPNVYNTSINEFNTQINGNVKPSHQAIGIDIVNSKSLIEYDCDYENSEIIINPLSLNTDILELIIQFIQGTLIKIQLIVFSKNHRWKRF
ncbi:2309_t:CDS:1 [Ambispora gerdemannii]|uniref:2309_t:CDS:1 n=1 Tax=Ambispora gerdemannii TaxID=144530 RepID=A0A9N8ZBJ6_9GLOM|nr:2309_t:CDS:1 [Ambispora gerdemannii]